MSSASEDGEIAEEMDTDQGRAASASGAPDRAGAKKKKTTFKEVLVSKAMPKKSKLSLKRRPQKTQDRRSENSGSLTRAILEITTLSNEELLKARGVCDALLLKTGVNQGSIKSTEVAPAAAVHPGCKSEVPRQNPPIWKQKEVNYTPLAKKLAAMDVDELKTSQARLDKETLKTARDAFKRLTALSVPREVRKSFILKGLSEQDPAAVIKDAIKRFEDNPTDFTF